MNEEMSTVLWVCYILHNKEIHSVISMWYYVQWIKHFTFRWTWQRSLLKSFGRTYLLSGSQLSQSAPQRLSNLVKEINGGGGVAGGQQNRHNPYRVCSQLVQIWSLLHSDDDGEVSMTGWRKEAKIQNNRPSLGCPALSPVLEEAPRAFTWIH